MQEVLKVVLVAVAAVINMFRFVLIPLKAILLSSTFAVGCLLVIGLLATAKAAVLPQDRSDVLYHSYQGDGVSIDGPSILLRKKIGNKVSISDKLLC